MARPALKTHRQTINEIIKSWLDHQMEQQVTSFCTQRQAPVVQGRVAAGKKRKAINQIPAAVNKVPKGVFHN